MHVRLREPRTCSLCTFCLRKAVHYTIVQFSRIKLLRITAATEDSLIIITLLCATVNAAISSCTFPPNIVYLFAGAKVTEADGHK